MRVGPPRNEHPGRLPDTDGAPILAGRRNNMKQGGKVFAGLDWASKTHMVCVVDDAGEIKIRFEIANTGKTFTGLVKRLTKLGVEGVAIERCDGPLVEALLEAGLRVVVITALRRAGVAADGRRGRRPADDARGRYPHVAILGDGHGRTDRSAAGAVALAVAYVSSVASGNTNSMTPPMTRRPQWTVSVASHRADDPRSGSSFVRPAGSY
jgi:hypothetical protein